VITSEKLGLIAESASTILADLLAAPRAGFQLGDALCATIAVGHAVIQFESIRAIPPSPDTPIAEGDRLLGLLVSTLVPAKESTLKSLMICLQL
jgi:hypothetical protein